MQIQTLFIALLFILIGFFNNCSPNMSLRPFTSDGCSMFPDESLIHKQDGSECCYKHDLAYWRGGTESARAIADSLFKDLLSRKLKISAWLKSCTTECAWEAVLTSLPGTDGDMAGILYEAINPKHRKS